MFNALIFALLMIVTMSPHLATQSRRPAAFVGFWESETCVVQDRDGIAGVKVEGNCLFLAALMIRTVARHDAGSLQPKSHRFPHKPRQVP